MAITIGKLILFIVTLFCGVGAIIAFVENLNAYGISDDSDTSDTSDGDTSQHKRTDPDFWNYLWQAFLQMIICWFAITPWIEYKSFGGTSVGISEILMYLIMFFSFVLAWLALILYTSVSSKVCVSLAFASTLVSVIAVIIQAWKFKVIAKEKKEEEKRKKMEMKSKVNLLSKQSSKYGLFRATYGFERRD